MRDNLIKIALPIHKQAREYYMWLKICRGVMIRHFFVVDKVMITHSPLGTSIS